MDLIVSLFPHEIFFDLTIYQFGYEQCRPSHLFGPAVRSHFLFHYILSGKGLLMSTDDNGVGHDYFLETGQGFLLWPGQNNTYIADEKEPWEYVWIEFDGLKAKELMIRAGLLQSAPVYNSGSEEARARVKKELMYIVTHGQTSPLDIMGHMYLFMDALTFTGAPKDPEAVSGLKAFYLREAVSYIEQHYQEGITVQDVVKFSKLNRNYLGRIFKNVLGVTPQEFLIGYRVQNACALLIDSDRSIIEISNMVGYPNPLNFSRAFKRETGQSPQNWRQMHKR